MFEGLIREGIKTIGPHKIGDIFHKSKELPYKWANGCKRAPDQSPNTNPVQLMYEFLEYLAHNGGLKLAIRIVSEFQKALIAKEGIG